MLPQANTGRTRGGCLTCRARHVKCSEERPSCQRCLRGGRSCKWGARNNDLHKIVVYTAQRQPSSLPGVPQEEQRALDFCSGRLAHELAGHYITSDLWSYHLLQLSLCEPAVRHAVVALSSICEHMQYGDGSSTVSERFALVQYGKAVRLVAYGTTSDSTYEDVPLLVSVLLGAFERLTGHPESAFAHRIGGLKMLDERGKASERSMAAGTPAALLHATFLQLDTETLELGNPAFGTEATVMIAHRLGMPPDLRTIDDAWHTFEPLFNQILRTLKKRDHAQTTQCPASCSKGPPHRIYETVWRYEEWCIVFDRYLQMTLPSLRNQTSKHDLLGILVLQIHRLFLRTILHIDLVNGEMSFEPFSAEFHYIVALAECFLAQIWTPASKPSPLALKEEIPAVSHHGMSLEELSQGLLCIQAGNLPVIGASEPRLDSRSLSSSSDLLTSIPSKKALFKPLVSCRPTFSVAPGVVCPLFITAMHCCEATTRDRALRLLQFCNRKEGHWDSKVCASVARTSMIRREESDVQFVDIFA